MTDEILCAHCGKIIKNPSHPSPTGIYFCSFSCEVKNLLGKSGWGFRWFSTAMVWGLALLATMFLLVRVFLGRPIANPPAYFGLIIVLGLMTAILTVLLKRVTR